MVQQCAKFRPYWNSGVRELTSHKTWYVQIISEQDNTVMLCLRGWRWHSGSRSSSVLQSKGGDRRHGEACCDRQLLSILPLVLAHRAYSHISICLVLQSQAPSYKTVTFKQMIALITCHFQTFVQNTGSPLRPLHTCQNILHLYNSGYGLPPPIAALTDTLSLPHRPATHNGPSIFSKRPWRLT